MGKCGVMSMMGDCSKRLARRPLTNEMRGKGTGDSQNLQLSGLSPHRGDTTPYLVRAEPRANTELGAVTLMGLTTGWVEMARLIGWASMEMPLASWSSTSLRRLIESRYSIILLFRLAQRSCVMQRPPS